MRSNDLNHVADPRSGWTFNYLLRGAVVLLVVLACGLAMSPSVADPDLWGHVQFGRDALDRGNVAATTSYSFTAEGFRWINHENLSEITMAVIVDTLGPGGLLWGKFILSMLIIGGIFWFNLRQGVSLMATATLALLVAANLGYHWSFRPQLSSLVLFTAMIMLLQIGFGGWRAQSESKLKNESDDCRKPTSWIASHHQSLALWLCILILLIWTNAHGGFVAGVCIFVAYLVLRAVEAYLAGGPDQGVVIRRLSLVALAAMLVTLVNPYSYRLPMWLMESLGRPRPEIVDWSNGQLLTMIGVKFWFLVAVAVFALVASRKQRDLVHAVILGITLWQALSHFRHVPFFTILCGFWLGPHLQSAMQRFQRSSTSPDFFALSRFRQMAVGCLLLLMIGGICFRLSERLNRIQVDRSVYPVDAFNFMAEHRIHGRIVVTYNWAQYAIGALCASPGGQEQLSRVAFDGRFRTCYPQEIVDMHFDFLYGDQDMIPRYRSPASPPVDPGRVLGFGHPDLVIIKRFDEATSTFMEQQPAWSLLYQDGLAQVWGLQKKYDNPQSNQYLPQHRRVITSALPTGSAAWPAWPSASIKQDSDPQLPQNALAFQSTLNIQ